MGGLLVLYSAEGPGGGRALHLASSLLQYGKCNLLTASVQTLY